MELREKILKAAADVFSEVGFRGATTRRIAQEAGVNEITLFRHFGSKASLLHEAIACQGGQRLAAVLPETPGDVRAELLAWAREQIGHYREHRSFIRSCMAEVEEHPEMVAASNPSAQANDSLRSYLRALKASGRARASFDPDVAAPMLLGVLFSDAMGRDVMPLVFASDPDHAVTQYVELFLRALGVASDAEGAPQARSE